MTENNIQVVKPKRFTLAKILRIFFITFGLVFLYAPILSLIIYSFNASKMMTVWGGWSIKWYFALFADKQMMDAVLTSLIVSFCAASMSVIIGTLAAIVLARISKFKGETLFALFITAPMVLPEVIVGLSMLLLFVTLSDLIGWPQRGMVTIWIAMVTVTAAYVTVVVRSRLMELDYSIEEASQDLGAGPVKTFFAITLPSILPAIISGWLLAFTLAMDDLVITTFVSGPSSSTLPMVVFSSVRRGLNPEINALATIIVFIVSLCTFCYWLVRVRKEKRMRQDMKMAMLAQATRK
ncbi:MAG: ABC transporter permease subunit [Succinivibrionaceae bacterium]|nr:ABC transporter permease subunit [Ruminobacter sp.]MDY5778674.1 ABC transporter permease subunit [Succinivibrionaceae bacterium]MEE1340431.1 ABC transporter permease subunit [Succinivibrionaceae bacterium]